MTQHYIKPPEPLWQARLVACRLHEHLVLATGSAAKDDREYFSQAAEQRLVDLAGHMGFEIVRKA